MNDEMNPVAAQVEERGAAGGKPRSRREWSPTASDQQVYEWVRLSGKTQSWVAGQLGLHQTTVSRIVQRYERWQAHAGDRDDGRLDPAERRRAQRLLAYERNEVVLASALRLADEMEGFVDVSKTVKQHPLHHPSAQETVRTEHAMLHRTGIAARFLRLAFQINMQQLKLTEAEPAPRPEPLTMEQVADEKAAAAQAETEFAQERVRQDAQAEKWSAEIRQYKEQEQVHGQLMQKAMADIAAMDAEAPEATEPATAAEPSQTAEPQPMEQPQAPEDAPRAAEPAPENMHPVHKMHTLNSPKNGASHKLPIVCAAEPGTGKILTTACMTIEPQAEPAEPPSSQPPLILIWPTSGSPRDSYRPRAPSGTS
jgi:hypothetical protein